MLALAFLLHLRRERIGGVGWSLHFLVLVVLLLDRLGFFPDVVQEAVFVEGAHGVMGELGLGHKAALDGKVDGIEAAEHAAVGRGLEVAAGEELAAAVHHIAAVVVGGVEGHVIVGVEQIFVPREIKTASF
jgi:hypothetical protein